MARKCTICTHEARDAIDRALIEHRAFRAISRQFGPSKDALIRHHDNHLPTELLKAAEVADVARASDLLDQVTTLRDRAIAILDKAEAGGEFRSALGAIREARGCLELLGKLAGQLQDAATINVIVTPEWQHLQAAVLAALEPHTEARLAVASALTDLGSLHAPGHA